MSLEDRVQGLEVRDKNNYELIMSHDTMIKNLCALLNTSYPPSHRPEGDTLKSLQKEAARLIQQVINEWGPLPVVGPLNNTRYYEYTEAYARWLHGPGELDVAWGLLANAFGGDWDKCTDLWKSRARDWERRWHAFEKFSTPAVQAAVIAGQADTIKQLHHKIAAMVSCAARDQKALKDAGFTVSDDLLTWKAPDTSRLQRAHDHQQNMAGLMLREAERNGVECDNLKAQLEQIRTIFGFSDSVDLPTNLRTFYNQATKTKDLQSNEIDGLKAALETERAANKKLQADNDARKDAQDGYNSAVRELMSLRQMIAEVDKALDDMKIVHYIAGRGARLHAAVELVGRYRSVMKLVHEGPPE